MPTELEVKKPKRKKKYLGAFFGDKKLKDALLAELEWHKEQDAIIKGSYGGVEITGSSGRKQWRGCAVGCSIKSLNKILGKNLRTRVHRHYETYLGIPEELASIEDSIFEALPAPDCYNWPIDFIRSIPVGADLRPVNADGLLDWDYSRTTLQRAAMVLSRLKAAKPALTHS